GRVVLSGRYIGTGWTRLSLDGSGGLRLRVLRTRVFGHGPCFNGLRLYTACVAGFIGVPGLCGARLALSGFRFSG
uniref:hypothetical protein n=1 Tax=Oceanicaulis sp. UBA2681 TaxID=1947007 RepID=UPI00257C4F2B